jgi:hypothetical protein
VSLDNADKVIEGGPSYREAKGGFSVVDRDNREK